MNPDEDSFRMEYISPFVAVVKPTDVNAYFDGVQVWLKQPIGYIAKAKLMQECGHLFAKRQPARFDYNYRQRVQLKQPGPEAISWIASRPDAFINQVELSLDLVFANAADRDDSVEFFNRHQTRRWHNKNQGIRRVETTRYDAARTAPNKIVVYPQDVCRITGQLDCLHIEWRANTRRAVICAGVRSGTDLIKFDHYGFWKSRLLLVDLNKERLGRLIRNRSAKTKRKADTEDGMDRRTGHVLLSAYDTMQELLDEYGARYRIQRILTYLPNDDWLPNPRQEEGPSHFYCNYRAEPPTRSPATP
jgi:hypothetical protein